MKSKIMKFFSDLGRSLMMPVAALAACGIILGITSALLKTQVQDAVPFLTASVPLFIITTLNKVSGIVFTLLPVLFAISIAFGLAKEDKGVAAFAGFIGYYTFLVASSCMISTGIMDFSAMKISNILGVDTVDMGALAGIMAGLVTAKLHNKYHKVQFPAAIAFYGGKRFVALVVLVSMTVIGLVMPLIWAPISVGIDGLGRIIRSSGAFGVFIFGTLERLLIPTGLHHVLHAAISGSTNATMHLPAIAHEFGIRIDADTFDRLHRGAHYLLNIRPSGDWPAQYFYYAGGVPRVMEEIKSMLHLDVMTVTGKTLGENLEELKKNGFYEHCDEILREKSKIFGRAIDREDIIHSFDNAKGTDGSIAILKGNLAPEGCVIKHTACPKEMFKAVLNAKPYDCEEACISAVLNGEVKPGDAVFIRYEGPRGSGMPEMFYTSSC